MRRLLSLLLFTPLLWAACASTEKASSGGNTGGSSAAPDAGAAHDAGMDVEAEADAEAGSPEAGACTLIRPYSTQNAACNACAEEKCCVEVNGCLADTDCDEGYVNCAIGCALDFDAGPDAGPDAMPTACLEDCAQQYPKGRQEYDAAIGCAEGACAAECQ
jgi:hypothetical protein